MQPSVKYKFYWSDLPLTGGIRASLIICFFLILAVTILQGFLPPQIPLFFGAPIGENQLVSSWGLITAPVFALAITIANTFIASKIEDDFTQKILVTASLFISILVFITVVRIIFLIGSF